MDNNWLNRTTKQLVENTSAGDMAERYGGQDFSTYASNAEWIYDPVMPDVLSKYLVITGDLVTEMAQAAKDKVDADEATARLDATVAELDAPGSLVGALAAVVRDFTGMTESEFKAAVRGKLVG